MTNPNYNVVVYRHTLPLEGYKSFISKVDEFTVADIDAVKSTCLEYSKGSSMSGKIDPDLVFEVCVGEFPVLVGYPDANRLSWI